MGIVGVQRREGGLEGQRGKWGRLFGVEFGSGHLNGDAEEETPAGLPAPSARSHRLPQLGQRKL